LEDAAKNGKAECMFKLKNVDAESLEIGQIMIEVTKEPEYNVELISCSFDPETLVIRFTL